MRVAFIHDWLIGMRGGEKCLEALCEIYPDSDIFTFFYEPGAVGTTIERHRVFESILGFGRKFHRYFLPVFGLGARSIEKQIEREHQKHPYDLVVSISHCAAKNVRAPKGVPHLCYCLTPPRYLWDQFDRYFHNRVVRASALALRSLLQRWDLEGARSPSAWISISDFVRERVRRVYGKDSQIIYPPVDVEFFKRDVTLSDSNYFLVVNALVPYKNTHLIIDAFRDLPYELVIVGSGPEEQRLRAMAGNRVRFAGRVSDLELRKLYGSARALVFAAEEDFGIAPVEMQAVGKPVIAYGSGGSVETVSAATGVFFSELSSGAIKAAVLEFLSTQERFTSESCRAHAEQFSRERFAREFQAVTERWAESDGAVVNA